MKKLILAAVTLTTAASVFAQGTVIFNNRSGGTSHVYAPLGPGDSTRIVGQGPGDSANTNLPPADFGGRAFLGANGLAGQYGASTTLAQLLGGPAGSPEASLQPSLGAPVSFRTGTAAGGNANTTATFANVAKDAASATFEMVAWDNISGLYPTWAQASVAWQSGLIAAGKSPLFNISSIGGDVNTPPGLFNAGAGGLVSFNLYFVPEPTMAALAGLGAAALMIFRRRK
jgi:hypothetical protein